MPDREPEPDRAELLRDARTIAVLGAHPRADRAAHFVPEYMNRNGYRMLPVNPLLSEDLWGERPVPTLRALKEPVDVVVVFRRPENVPDHLEDILAMDPKPKAVWLQQGIRHEGTAERLRAEGIGVVQDACMMVEHRRVA